MMRPTLVARRAENRIEHSQINSRESRFWVNFSAIINFKGFKFRNCIFLMR